MIFSEDVLIRLAILILGLCGFMVSRHIFKRKNDNKNPLVCPIRFDCHTVVHSDYSRLFGIPVEILGMVYYGLIAISYLFFVFTPGIMPTVLINFLIIVSFLAFLFSVYLIAIQIFVLKKGCSWCIVSALICALIFILTIATYHFSYIVQIFI
ncbi:hypothetical protein A2911_01005 [Candidatus Nomurabacteria bacterium RIFCSPLOWO2_01_FULL_40_15]|uniref:Vitamin K epoxide reductase domain-containing protein n=1 Tax=Candidatus Nomurabacteria bacterium RIFCSPLOWO2_01_FULL_40_15 TaxID=1801772 RepID=A0A1F6X507_9BACT|nr:MAG: hypothetical protein A2911_01005 [Candidatus Nomurabacteria bacterium RIFCSPLOWO2_01_FULL_40_15]